MNRQMPLSRRSALAILGAAPLAAAPALAQARAVRFRSVSVDTSPIAQRGATSYARAVSLYLTSSMRRIFAGRIDPSLRDAPTLVARVESVTLSANVGGSNGGFGPTSGGNNDNLDGAGLLIGPGGGVQARYPILSVLDAEAAGPWYGPDADAHRLEALCDHFAAWLRRKTEA